VVRVLMEGQDGFFLVRTCVRQGLATRNQRSILAGDGIIFDMLLCYASYIRVQGFLQK